MAGGVAAVRAFTEEAAEVRSLRRSSAQSEHRDRLGRLAEMMRQIEWRAGAVQEDRGEDAR